MLHAIEIFAVILFQLPNMPEPRPMLDQQTATYEQCTELVAKEAAKLKAIADAHPEQGFWFTGQCVMTRGEHTAPVQQAN